MSTWMAELTLIIVGLTTSGCGVGDCATFMQRAYVHLEAPDHVVLAHVAGTTPSDLVLTGTLNNKSLDLDCPTAVYVFDDEPAADSIPVISFEEPAPETLEGGGVRLFETLLPAWTETRPARDFPELDPVAEEGSELDLWVVVSTCSTATVDLRLGFEAGGCDPREAPSEAPFTLETHPSHR